MTGGRRQVLAAHHRTVEPQRYRLIEFDALPSTNGHAIERIRDLQHGDVIAARIQTAGRGRLQRQWVSHLPGNICLSLVLKPHNAPPETLAAATHYLAVIVCRALEADSVVAGIKWPNDVQVEGRKIAGILAEAVTVGAEFLGVVLGLGLNLNLAAATVAAIDQPATSLNLVSGHPVDRDLFLRRLLDLFFAGWDDFAAGGFESLRSDYERRAVFLGRTIIVHQPTGVICGRALNLEASGALRVQMENGSLHVLLAGDMTMDGCQPAQG
jgi:BirA family biotin operon repressor/biotin-[acetyl-CoA-carboxylase] ligase